MSRFTRTITALVFGNVPLAAVLWNGGISFGGVVSFLFADLIILPILDIYRRYYGAKMAALILGAYYAAMVVAGLIVDLVFRALHAVPVARHARVVQAAFQRGPTSVVDLFFLALVLAIRFGRTGGLAMLREMNGAPPRGAGRPTPA